MVAEQEASDMKNFQNNLAFAQQMDLEDPLRSFRSAFLIPKQEGKERAPLHSKNNQMLNIAKKKNI